MKITCSNCGKVVTRSKKDIENDIKTLSVTKEDYLAVYLCRQCRPYLHKLDWNIVSRFPNLPLWFIDKYKDKIDWKEMFFVRNLPEEVLEKYIDEIDKTWFVWHVLCLHQKLSPEFILRYLDKITKEIFRNSCFDQLPDLIKLLLKQKLKGEDL